MKILRRLKSIVYKCICGTFHKLKRAWELFLLRTVYRLRIMNSVQTLKFIKEKKCSIARYGDGEFDLMLQEHDLRFQESSPEIAKRLMDVMAFRNDKLLVCIPWSFNSLKFRNKESKKFWINWAVNGCKQKKIVKKIIEYAGKDYLFGDAQITRPYIAMKSAERADEIFPLLKSIWDNREVLIVEGESTRLGVGNDLFVNAESISRILAPAKNAFSCYREILETVCKCYEPDQLVIIALGPTATILAADLCNEGIQALDIGHVDIEYEWYLRKVRERVSIPGKYTNEVINNDEVLQCDDSDYQKQIIARINYE